MGGEEREADWASFEAAFEGSFAGLLRQGIESIEVSQITHRDS